jgi:hemolysin activation/secretion protein
MFTNLTLRSSRRITAPVLTVLTLTLALSLSAFAVKAEPVKPDSGAILEGAKPPEKPAESPAPNLKVVEPAPAAADNTKHIHVDGFRFSGELPVAETELQKVVAGQVGKDLTLNDLNQLAGQITHYLRERGFSVATAYIISRRKPLATVRWRSRLFPVNMGQSSLTTRPGWVMNA